MTDKIKNQTQIIIPVYNEEKQIIDTIQTIQNEGYQNITLVNDNSNDNTKKIIEKYCKNSKKITLLNHSVNLGAGAATKTGAIHALKKRSTQYLAFLDADGQHDITELNNSLKYLEDNQTIEVLLGNRDRSQMPTRKKILHWGSRILVHWETGIKLKDVHNGYVIMRKETYKKINITADRFEFLTELIHEIKNKKIKYKHFDTNIKYTEYSKTKGQPILNAPIIVLKTIHTRLIK